MASRLIDGVPPRYPTREELSSEEASHRLQEVIGEFFDQAETRITAREEIERRFEMELNAWANAERDHLGLDGMTLPYIPPGLEAEIAERNRAQVLTELGIDEIGSPPRLQVRAAAGVGKTIAMIEELARRAFWHKRHVHIFVPNSALAKELESKIASKGLRVKVIRGREADGMCAKRKAAKQAAALGLNVYQALCKRKVPDGRELTCQHFNNCPYIKQWRDTAPAIRIFAHNYIALPRPRPDGDGLPEPDLVIIDENAMGTLTDTTSFGVDRFEGPVFEAVREHLVNGTDLRQALLARGYTARRGRQFAHELQEQVESDVTPDMTDREAQSRLAEAERSETQKLAQFWLRVAAEIDLVHPFHGIEVCKDEAVNINGVWEKQDRIHVYWPHKPIIGRSTALLMIDADADLEINRIFFGPSLQSVEIAAKRNTYVVQCYSTRLSRTALLGSQPKQEPRETPTLQKVKRIIQNEVDREGKVLAVMSLQVQKFLLYPDDDERTRKKRKLGRSENWQGADVAHFGYLRGSDIWADYDTIIVVGREQPRPIDIERKARAIWADDPKPLQFIGPRKPNKGSGLDEVACGYRLRDGSLKGVMTPVHPDPRVQRLMEQAREKELVQAIDRLRLIHAPEPKKIIILCSIPLDITVDELRTLDELAGTPGREGPLARLQRTLNTCGMLPLGARDLHEAFDGGPLDLFPSEESAKAAMKAVRKMARTNGAENGGGNHIEYIIGVAPHFRAATYRRAGQRGRASHVIYDPTRHRDPRSLLSILLREEVVEFEDACASNLDSHAPQSPETE